LAAAARASEQPQQLTLIRYTRAAASAAAGEADAKQVDINAVPMNDTLAANWEEQGARLQPSQLAVDVQPALELAEQLIRAAADQRCVLHILSDFRQPDWNRPQTVRDRLGRLAQLGTEIQLVRCTDAAAGNLAVVSLAPEPGTRAAGVPLMMTAAVRNLGTAPLSQVRLKARSTLFTTNLRRRRPSCPTC
jgi:hypothetical protein